MRDYDGDSPRNRRIDVSAETVAGKRGGREIEDTANARAVQPQRVAVAIE